MNAPTKKTILIADDEAPIRNIIKKCLPGYAFLEAQDGVQALEMAQAQHPDLILLDIMMPKMNGYDVCHKLKTDLSTRAIPIVMITGLGYDLNAKLSQSLGANAYITKPFTTKDLTDTVERLLG
jgi:two-component system alkaline phosphatase synthesis response regulator PhoP